MSATDPVPPAPADAPKGEAPKLEAVEPAKDRAKGPSSPNGAAPGTNAAATEAGPKREATESGETEAVRGPGLAERGAEALTAVAQTTARTVQLASAEVAQLRKEETEAWEDAVARAELPEPGRSADPLHDLVLRAHREAEFFRTLAVRSLKPGPGRVLAILSGGIALVAGTITAIAAGIRAFFGEGIGEAAGIEALALAVVLGVAAGVGLLLERDARRRGEAALAKAALAERRIERLAVVLALRSHDVARFADAVSRIEREPTR